MTRNDGFPVVIPCFVARSNFLVIQRSNIPLVVDRLATARLEDWVIAPHADSSLTGYPNRSKLPRSARPHRDSWGSRNLLCDVILCRPCAGKSGFGASSCSKYRAASSQFLSFGVTTATASGGAAQRPASGTVACSINCSATAARRQRVTRTRRYDKCVGTFAGSVGQRARQYRRTRGNGADL